MNEGEEEDTHIGNWRRSKGLKNDGGGVKENSRSSCFLTLDVIINVNM